MAVTTYEKLINASKCVVCRKANAFTRVMCDECHTVTTEKRKLFKRSLKENSLCSRCEQSLDGEFSTCNTCRNYLNNKAKEQKLRRKKKLFELLGNACACCGENITLLLSVDHTNNDGKSKRLLGDGKGEALYMKLLREKNLDGLQLLCLGCNQGKYLNNGTCPHEDERSNDTIFRVTSPNEDRLIFYEELYPRVKGSCCVCRCKIKPHMYFCNGCIPGVHQRAAFTVWRNRLDVLKVYGKECNCCGESNLRLLTLDHIHNDASAERQRGLNLRSAKTYAWIIKNNFPSNIFQVLCITCNIGKHFNLGVCPHQTKGC